MSFVVRKLKKGDHIRVKRSFYFHHGLYIGNNEVIHYTGEVSDSIDNPSEVKVRITSIDFFKKEGIVEAYNPTLKERLLYTKRRNKRIKEAKMLLGENNYNFLHNNCEDFVNRVSYKKKLTSQIDDLKKKI